MQLEMDSCQPLSFEVLYIGKIKVSHRTAPRTFIDDALAKFKQHELNKLALTKNSEAKSKSSEESNVASLSRHTSHDSSFKQKMEYMKLKEEIRQRNVSGEKRCSVSGSAPHVEEYRSRAHSFAGSGTPVSNAKLLIPAQNRTMLLQIGRHDLQVISLDHKSLILHKSFVDVSHCSQGGGNPDHFGFICSEDAVDGYAGYVFKCESRDVVEHILTALKQAFQWWHDSIVRKETKCAFCPLVRLEHLCQQLEETDLNKRTALVHQWIEDSPQEFHENLMSQLMHIDKESSPDTYSEKVMDTIRNCAAIAQETHKHTTRSEMVLEKAKKFTLDQIWKRVEGKDHSSGNLSENNAPSRKRASTIGTYLSDNVRKDFGRRRISSGQSRPLNKFIKAESVDWGMLKREYSKSPDSRGGTEEREFPNRSLDELMMLWRRAVFKEILLRRWIKLQPQREALAKEAEAHEKLLYDPLFSYPDSASVRWEKILAAEEHGRSELKRAVWDGVPQALRGEVWKCLASLAMRETDMSAKMYTELSQKLTSYQHAILQDVGRTFPTHPYFQRPWGTGQLALFNLLKAYSLLDPEVGYCQGMGFVAASLLIHLEETEAFCILKHLMLAAGLRGQYLGDLSVIPVWMYQLSRVFASELPDLYFHLDNCGVNGSLYAAPWFLSCFANSFPIGFVLRAMDFLLAEGTDALFRICVGVMDVFQDVLRDCDGFESIVDFLKHEIGDITPTQAEEVFEKAQSYNFAKYLPGYAEEHYELYGSSCSRIDTRKLLQMFQKKDNELKEARLEFEKLKSQVRDLLDFLPEINISVQEVQAFQDLKSSSGSMQHDYSLLRMMMN